MRLLAIDTALDACSVAVVSGPRIVAETDVIGRGHAERLVAMIEAVMAKADCGFSDLDRIAVTVGPGSFTGIRVGLATARGLALAAGKPLVGVLTLDAMVQGTQGSGRPVSPSAPTTTRSPAAIHSEAPLTKLPSTRKN